MSEADRRHVVALRDSYGADTEAVAAAALDAFEQTGPPDSLALKKSNNTSSPVQGTIRWPFVAGI